MSFQTDSGSVGLATMTAVAAVGNPRNVPGSKKLILDVQIYVGSEKCESLLGALSYFNGSDMVFDNDDVALYLIYSTFSRFETGAEIHPTQISPSKYDFVGDIQWIIPLTPPSSGSDIDCSSFSIDPRQRAYLHVSGVALNCQKPLGTFDIDPEHYISILKDVKAKSKPLKPVAPISCFIPDSPRYKQGKPVPYNRRYVAVSGFLTDVTHKPDSVDIVQRYQLKVENIVFLGQQSGATVPNSLDSPERTPRNTKGLINYSRKQPATPATPTPVSQGPPRKRARMELDSSSDTLPSEESSQQ